MEKSVKIAIFAPASLPDLEEYEKALAFLKNAGLEVFSLVEFTSKTPYQKAKELFSLLKDTSLDYLWAVRGGFGCVKLFPYLDGFLEKDVEFYPKPCLIGFSDITALHLYLYKRFKKTGIHAPNVVSLNYLKEKAWKELLGLILRKKKERILEGRALIEGEAEGLILGGNLITLASLCGTPYFSVDEPFILFIEETKEKPYRIERALLQIIFTVGAEKIKGLAVGDFGISEVKPLLEKVLPYLKKNLPVGYGFPVGHTSNNLPFFLGKRGCLKIFKNRALFSQKVG
ncbi:LD-carboxypeptidase [Thermodesulfobacterium sp. TA1]|uniref:LD-carboxypeptidase n=1 Tax=Thermodesulfobacterium sp. TA1 TaxID=2234087 RepID=UPI0012329BA9|nr:LD-carboxypeptidase [Thermodesulfobacterium sp. TA1]QER42069.1 LD-carboxypeptidase [Thermodesulfobacterium sp. TA1]